MTIHVQCGGCGAKFEAPEKFAGKRVKCPKCSAVVTVGERSQRPSGQATAPAEEETPLIPVACRCGKKLRVKAKLAGKRVKCPACGQAFTVADIQPAVAQPDGELDLGQLAGVEESAATTLGAPLSQVKKKEQPSHTRLIIGLSVGGSAAVLVLLLVLVLWPSGEDEELAKENGASIESLTEAAETPPATGSDESAARTDEELIDSQVLTRAATELFAQSVAHAKETGQAVPPGDAVAELTKIHPTVLRITKDQESRLAAGQFDDQATSNRLQAVIKQWSGMDSYLKGSHPPGLKYLVQQFRDGKLQGAHLEVALRLLDAEFVAYVQAMGGSARPLSQERPPAGEGRSRTYPSLPDALTEPPPWIGPGAPFDVAKFFETPPPEENGALLYLDALFEFSPDVAMCFYEQGQEPEGGILQRAEIANVRHKEYSRLEEARQKNPASADNAAVDAWLAQYETGFQKLAQAQNRPQCVFEAGLGVDSLVPHAQGTREVARVVKWRTRRDLARGDFERPIQGVETVLRLSRDLRPRGNQICQLVSVAMDQICYQESVVAILTAPGIEAKHCDRLIAILRQHEQAPDMYVEALRQGYSVVRTVLDDVEHRAGTVDPNVAALVGKTLWQGTNRPRDRKERARQVEQYLATVNFQQEREALDRWYRSVAGLSESTLREREQRLPGLTEEAEKGKLLIAAILPPLVPFSQAIARHRTYHRGTKCLVALRRWQLEHDTPPSDLTAVIQAAGMKEVPTDPFSGQPMRMTMVNGEPVIYSVAMDGKDDRGRVDVWESSQRGKLGDLLFRLNASQ